MQIANYAQKNTVKNCRGSLDEQQGKGGELAGGLCGLYLRVNQARTCYTAQCTPPKRLQAAPLLCVCAKVSIRYICLVCSQRVQKRSRQAEKEAAKGAKSVAKAETANRRRGGERERAEERKREMANTVHA